MLPPAETSGPTERTLRNTVFRFSRIMCPRRSPESLYRLAAGEPSDQIHQGIDGLAFAAEMLGQTFHVFCSGEVCPQPCQPSRPGRYPALQGIVLVLLNECHIRVPSGLQKRKSHCVSQPACGPGDNDLPPSIAHRSLLLHPAQTSTIPLEYRGIEPG